MRPLAGEFADIKGQFAGRLGEVLVAADFGKP